MFELVEAVGMPDKQEHAFKGVIRNTTYAMQRELEQELADDWIDDPEDG